MVIVGLDLSIRFPGICVSHDFKTFEFIAVVNDPKITGPSLSFLSEMKYTYSDIDFKILPANRPAAKDAYYVKEREKTVMFDAIATTVAQEAMKCIGSETEVMVAMEGISYGSKGSAFVDTVLLTGFMRSRILSTILSHNAPRFFVFAPSELKQAIGLKGNADKWEICNRFVADPGIPEAVGCGMHRLMSDNLVAEEPKVYKMNAKEIQSPFNDMIDAYLSVLKIYNSLSIQK